MASSGYAWKTRGELAEELARLEQRADVQTRWTDSLAGHGASAGEYDPWRRQLRRAYFRVADGELRKAMIALAIELHRRDRVDANLERLTAQRAVASAREGEDTRALALAVAIPLICVGVGYLLAGVPGEVGGVVVAILLSGWVFRRHRRSVESAVEQAREGLKRAERGASDFEARPAPFDAGEAASGIENPQFGALCCEGADARGPERASLGRLWSAPGSCSVT